MATKKLTQSPHQQSSILKDFQTLLDYTQSSNQLVSKKNLVLSAKTLLEINSLMSKSIAHNKVRPQQTTFPHIAVIYNCAHQLSFFNYTDKGSRKQIKLNPAALDAWNILNPTEQYFTLIDRWLFGSDDKARFLAPIERIQWFKHTALNKSKVYYQSIFTTEYQMGDLLAGMELFGLIKIQHAKPENAGGWKINSLSLTKLGDLTFNILLEKEREETFIDLLTKATLKSNDFTNFKLFQSYFPDLQNTYQVKKLVSIQLGLYIFKVSLHQSWRQIAVNHTVTLDGFANIILQAFDFDDDHLHSFNFTDTNGQKREYQHPACDADHFSNEVTLSELPLGIKGSMKFIFDFGDWWEFDIILEGIDSDNKLIDVDAEFIDGEGEAPEQYPDWDD